MDFCVSVIVPIYNVQPYLEKCLNSICEQTYHNIEIILVDDGSTDTGRKICDLYSKRDDRFVVIHQANMGLVRARKTGISVATGTYSIYVDGDDWIEKDWVEKLVSAMDANNVELVCANHIIDYGDFQKTEKNGIIEGNYSVEEIIGNCLYKEFFYSFGITQYVWSKMYRTDLLKKVQFEIPDSISIGEDVALTFSYIAQANHVSVINLEGYHYVQHNNSMCNIIEQNEKSRCDVLVKYLKETLLCSKWAEPIQSQLNQYIKLLFLSRSFESQYSPFGYIPPNYRVVVYGAGAIGRSVVQALKKGSIRIISWLDRDYARMQDRDCNISNPEIFDYNRKDYDLIIIALANEYISKDIEKYLIWKGATENKIRSITQEFIQLNVLDYVK